MKVASLFSGCGGLDLGLRRAGHDIVLQCEIDPICQSVLKKNFAGTLLCPDVCGIVELPLEIELLTAGFPCIDLSTAGLKAGIYGEHSGLWIHILRLVKKAIDNHRPVPWILCENVPGILNTYGRETTGVECLATEFERLGYNWCYRIVNSASFGTPVARRRFFFLASLHGDPRDVLLCRGRGKCLGGCSSSGLELGGEAEGDASSSSCRRKPCVECYMLNPTDPDFVLNLSRAHVPTPGIVPTVTASNAQHLCAVLSSQAQVGMLTAESVEALQGFPSGFTSLSSGLSLSEAASDRLRFGMLGNAVSVNTAEWLGNQLAQVYSQKYVMSGLDRPFPSNVYHNSEEYDSDDSVQPLTKEGFEVSWPGSAWFVKGLGRHCCECSECPVKTSLDSVASVLSCSIDKNDNDSDSRQRKKKLQRELRMYAKKLEPLGYQPDRLNESINRCGVGNAGPIQEKKKDAFIEVGDLVWAKIKSYPWWPGEVLNLDQYAITDLPSLIPARLLGSYMKYREKTGSRPEERKKQLCLVSFFGDQTFAWLEKGKLLSFEVNHERMMDNLLIANQLHNAKLQHAMKEAEAASQLRALQSSEEEEEVIAAGIDGIYEKDFLLSRYSHKSRASYLAAMAEKEDKCRSCAACLKVLKYEGLRDRKCLRNRAWAAAAAGHSGAQVAILGNHAIGTKVKVFWPEDGEWYEGNISGFDRMHMKHTVSYLDGDVEEVFLWSASLEIVILEFGSGPLLVPRSNDEQANQQPGVASQQPAVVAPSTPEPKPKPNGKGKSIQQQEAGQSSSAHHQVPTANTDPPASSGDEHEQQHRSKRQKKLPLRLGWAEDSEIYFSGGSGMMGSGFQEKAKSAKEGSSWEGKG